MLEQNALSYAKLKLNVDVPDLDENWLDGYESAQSDSPEEANPYQIGSTEYQQWNEGWWAGFFNEEKLFDWCDTSIKTEVDEVITRVQQAAAPVLTNTEIKLSRTKVILGHVVQVAATVMAFGICYQFADFFA